MCPLSGIRFSYEAEWELISAPPLNLDNEDDDVLMTFRRHWYSKAVHQTKEQGGNIEQVNHVDEYIYLLVIAAGLKKALDLADALKELIEQNIQYGKHPDAVDYICTDVSCSYIIQIRQTA